MGVFGKTDFLEDEYRPHFEAWKAKPSPASSGALLYALHPVLETAVKSYAQGGQNPVLKSRAKILALKALESYDPSRAKLRTYLLSQMRGLQRYAAQANQAVRLPERIALGLGHLRDAEKELEDGLGRPPSTQELADHTGMSPRRLAKLRGVRPGLAEGQLIGSPDDEGDVSQPAVVTPRSRQAWLDFVYGDLHPRDQVIFEHVLGYHGRPVLSKTEIARKLGISAGAVSQRLARIQEKLDMEDRAGGLF